MSGANRKLTTQIPGEPLQEPAATEQIALASEQQATDPVPVVERGVLPDSSEIDAKTIDRPVLTQQGYVVPGR